MYYILDLARTTLFNLGHAVYEALPSLIAAAITYFIFWLCSKTLKTSIIAIGQKTRLDETLTKALAGMSAFLITVIGILVACTIVIPDFSIGNLIAGLGITSVAIGFAFKDIIQNFLAGMLLLWRRPFNIGDEIATNNFNGIVTGLDIRSTHIRTYDGLNVVIPNAQVYSQPVQVISPHDARRIELIVGIGYCDSIEEARAVIYETLGHIEEVLHYPSPHVLVADLAPSSVNLKIWFWVKQELPLPIAIDKVATGIKLALDKNKIDMPYPHQVVLLKQLNSDSELLSKENETVFSAESSAKS